MVVRAIRVIIGLLGLMYSAVVDLRALSANLKLDSQIDNNTNVIT